MKFIIACFITLSFLAYPSLARGQTVAEWLTEISEEETDSSPEESGDQPIEESPMVMETSNWEMGIPHPLVPNILSVSLLSQIQNESLYSDTEIRYTFIRKTSAVFQFNFCGLRCDQRKIASEIGLSAAPWNWFAIEILARKSSESPFNFWVSGIFRYTRGPWEAGISPVLVVPYKKQPKLGGDLTIGYGLVSSGFQILRNSDYFQGTFFIESGIPIFDHVEFWSRMEVGILSLELTGGAGFRLYI